LNAGVTNKALEEAVEIIVCLGYVAQQVCEYLRLLVYRLSHARCVIHDDGGKRYGDSEHGRVQALGSTGGGSETAHEGGMRTGHSAGTQQESGIELPVAHRIQQCLQYLGGYPRQCWRGDHLVRKYLFQNGHQVLVPEAIRLHYLSYSCLPSDSTLGY